MPSTLYAKPSANVIAGATLSWAVGTANASFPLTNAKTLEPDVVAKANETTATLRLTYSGAQALEGLALFNINGRGLTIALTNNGGMATQNKVVPNPEDGLGVNVYWDLRGVASASAAQWNVAVVSAAGPVTFGTVVPISSWSTAMHIRWGFELRDVFPVIPKRTGYKKRLQYRIPVRYRMFSGVAPLAADRNALRTLRRETFGTITPWVFVPNSSEGEVLLVQFADEQFSETTKIFRGSFDSSTVHGAVDQPISLEEVNAGVALV